MHKLGKLFGFSLASMGAILVAGGVSAAETGRAAYSVSNVNSRAGSVSASQRMPTMPTLPGNSTGNLSPNLPSGSTNKPTGDKCSDGGVKNSEYTVEQCMNDVLSCIDNGALPGGLNDMFNEDLRNAIVNGMGLCSVQVDKCVTTVRKNCINVYNSSSSVWIDFNSRKIQPGYYSFILRKTGLTPNQAENTCWLLDKNTYGSSFTAVSNDGVVTAEYAGIVGAYNNQGGSDLQKAAPQGVKVNDKNTGVDGQRGHYARWDATTGECLVRVAAYNKDSHIKNDWLFGALGDNKPAEVWKAAGTNFSCNKDLFGFSLMNKTSTAAVVGVGGGTVVGAGVGAIVGHGKRAFDCTNNSQRKELSKQLDEVKDGTGILNQYLGTALPAGGGIIDEDQCESIAGLFAKYQQYKTADKSCVGSSNNSTTVTQTALTVSVANFKNDSDQYYNNAESIDFTHIWMDGAWAELKTMEDYQKEGINKGDYLTVTLAKENVAESGSSADDCPKFKRLSIAGNLDSILCDPKATTSDCISGKELVTELEPLDRVFKKIKILDGEDTNMLKTTLVGAGVGAATGGLATAITAFVEKNNISCRVGDGLEKVSFGKSYRIGSLKDFYVKWNLRLPDTIMPTAQVVDCESWQKACATLTDLNQCASAQINYRPANSASTTLVDTACSVSGSACIQNSVVATSVGACK